MMITIPEGYCLQQNNNHSENNNIVKAMKEL